MRGFERVDFQFVRGPNGLLRPTTSSPIRTDLASEVKQDIDGFRRPTKVVCGCDEPDTPMRQWPTQTNTGPKWQD